MPITLPLRPILLVGILVILGLLAALLAAAPASAQSSTVLVSNVNQTIRASTSLGAIDQAQAFTTGPAANGYTLTSVGISFGGLTSTATKYGVSIHERYSNGQPSTKLGDLTGPASLTANRVNYFTTSGINLSPNTTYFVVIDSSSGLSNLVHNTESHAEEATSLSGWSIANGRLGRLRIRTTSFHVSYPSPMLMRLHGTANPAPAVPRAGYGWLPQASNVTSNLYDVHFADSNNGWIVGFSGTILRTADGGANWSRQSSGTNRVLFGVHFADASNGWAVGFNGTILRTTNGGASWSAQSSGTSGFLTAVHFVDASRGWAVGNGGIILRTTDGGANWSAQSSRTSNNLLDVHFADASRGWAVGNGGIILRTTDGGANWSAQSSGTTGDLARADFINASRGWVVGANGTILRTTDGGANWRPQSTSTRFLWGVHFLDANTAWAVGESGTVLHTTDGGSNWSAQRSGTTQLLQAVHFVDENTGWAVGNNGTILAFGERPLPLDLSLFHQCCIYEDGGRQEFTMRVGLAFKQTEDLRVNLSYDLGEAADDFESFEIFEMDGVTVPAGWTWAVTHVIATPREDEVDEPEKRLTVTASATIDGVIYTDTQELKLIDNAPAVPAPPPSDRPTVELTGLVVRPLLFNPTVLIVEWDPVEGVTQYRLSGPHHNEVRTTETSHRYEGLDPGTAYTVKVEAWDLDSRPIFKLGEAEASGTTGEAGSMVFMARPGATDPTTQIDLSWEAPQGAPVERYFINWRRIVGTNDGRPVYGARDWSKRIERDSNGNLPTSYSVTGLTPDSNYEFRLRAIDGHGNTVAESPLTTGRTVLPMTEVSIGYDENHAIQLEWSAVKGKWTEARWYRIYWRTGNDQYASIRDFYCWNFDSAEPASCEANLSSLIRDHGSSPDITRRHDVRIVPSITFGQGFYDGPAAEVSTLPRVGGVRPRALGWSDTQIRVLWWNVPNIGVSQNWLYFHYRVAGSGDGWTVVGHVVQPNTSLRIQDLVPDTSYEVRLRVAPTNYPPDDQVLAESILTARTHQTFRDLWVNRVPGSTDTLHVSWGKLDDVDNYRVQWKLASATGDSWLGTHDASSTDNGYTIEGLQENTLYVVRVTLVRELPSGLAWSHAAAPYLEDRARTDTSATAAPREKTPLDLGALVFDSCVDDDCNTKMTTSIFFQWEGMPTVGGAEVTRYTFQMSTDGETGWADTTDSAEGRCQADMAAEDGKMDGSRYDPDNPDANDAGFVPAKVAPNCIVLLKDESGISAGDTRYFRVIAKSADGNQSQTGPAAKIETTGAGQRGAPQQPPPTGGAIGGSEPPDQEPTFGDRTIAAKSYIQNSPVDETLPEATGGDGTLTYSIAETLPAGLEFSSSTRKITGTPTGTQAATYYTYKVSDADGDQAAILFAIAIAEDLTPSFGDQTIAAKSYTQDTAVDDTLPPANGGNRTLIYSIVGTLPAGLQFSSSTRKITGTPTGTQTATNYTYRVTDSDGDTADLSFTIAVVEQDGATGTSDSSQSVAFVVYLPDSSDIQGQGRADTGNARIKSADLEYRTVAYGDTDPDAGPPEDGARLPRWYRVDGESHDGRTWGGLRWLEAALPEDLKPSFDGRTIAAKSYLQNSAVDDTLPAATGGDGTLTYAIVGTLPPGLQFNASTRQITGTPTTAEAATSYTYRVSDSDDDQEDILFSIAIAEDLTPSFGDRTIAAKNYTQNTAVDDTLPAATGGNGTLSYTIVGTLPAGLQFSSSTRKISGTPTTAEDATSYTYRVTDSDGDTADLSFTIAVAEEDGATGTSEPSVAFVVYEPASGDKDAAARLDEGNNLIKSAGLAYRTVAHGETDPDAGPPEDTARLPRWYRIDGESHDGRTSGGLRWLKAALDE